MARRLRCQSCWQESSAGDSQARLQAEHEKARQPALYVRWPSQIHALFRPWRAQPPDKPDGALQVTLIAEAIATAGTPAWSDEGGVSAWLPGTFGSMAAAPTVPGWALATVYYHTSLAAGGNVAASREIEIGRFTPTATANLSA